MSDESAPLNRMIIAVLALVGLLISAYLTLHKYGFIGTLACGTGSCETVQMSKWAVFLGVPVPVMGLVGYAIILGIALVGLQNVDSRNIALALLILATGAFGFSIYLSLIEQFRIHAWCRWCIASATISTLIWICSLAELRRLRRTT